MLKNFRPKPFTPNMGIENAQYPVPSLNVYSLYKFASAQKFIQFIMIVVIDYESFISKTSQ